MPEELNKPGNRPRKPMSSGLETLVEAEKLMQIALVIPSAAFLGWLGGGWLDGRLKVEWISTVGLVFGGLSGLVYVFKLTMLAGERLDRKAGFKKRKRRNGRGEAGSAGSGDDSQY